MTTPSAGDDPPLTTAASPLRRSQWARIYECTVNYAPLAVTTFGGPQAHIAIIHGVFVQNKAWLSEDMFAELYALAQSLPGPASTQLAFAIAVPYVFPCLMLAGGLVTHAVHTADPAPPDVEAARADPHICFAYSWAVGLGLFAAWAGLLVAAVVCRHATDVRALHVWGTFYFTGSIIFGGGPVMIPLLQSYVVGPGWLTDREYLIGLAAINALPGPLFNFAAYCGALALRASIGSAVAGALLLRSGRRVARLPGRVHARPDPNRRRAAAMAPLPLAAGAAARIQGHERGSHRSRVRCGVSVME
ncbi:hypothetical protein SeMB42_g02717 [Synchytrium endobioticum]|uniref:Chromate transporter n=1 Tax=Synchytrium endobioticum TaxID=286115 RepID=A0A507DCN3_9FUNG|nr:hypothetical protein SeMB42_g02717 [Synchytrium endobioticum]